MKAQEILSPAIRTKAEPWLSHGAFLNPEEAVCLVYKIYVLIYWRDKNVTIRGKKG
jgi:hypothetical protein